MSTRTGLSADCKLSPIIVMGIVAGGKEHPCDRCNHDRKECRGYPRLDDAQKQSTNKESGAMTDDVMKLVGVGRGRRWPVELEKLGQRFRQGQWSKGARMAGFFEDDEEQGDREGVCRVCVM